MLTIPPAPFRNRRGRPLRRPPAATPPPVAPTLVAATYAESTEVSLDFDRPVDVAGFDGSQIVVDDAEFALTRYAATGLVTQTGPASLLIGLEPIGPATGGSGVTLTASAASGIVAVDGGAAWAGVADVELPFP